MPKHFWTISVKRKNENFPEERGVCAGSFETLCSLYPQYKTSESFISIPQISEDDPLFESFIRDAKANGVSVPFDRSDQMGGVSLYKLRSFSDSELRSFQLFEPWHDGPILAEVQWGNSGEPYILSEPRLKKQRKHEFGHAYASASIMLVRGNAKIALEQSGLRGLKLRALPLGDRKFWQGFNPIDQWPKDVEPLYQVWSDVQMPPCVNWLFDNSGSVFPSSGHRGPFQEGCLPLEGHFSQPQLHFRSKDVSSLGEWDVAYSYERFGNTDSAARPALLVSPKFIKAIHDFGFKGVSYFPHCLDDTPWLHGVDGPAHPRLNKTLG